jgi:hypothetical protein
VRDLELKDLHLFTGAVESIRRPSGSRCQASDSRSERSARRDRVSVIRAI